MAKHRGIKLFALASLGGLASLPVYANYGSMLTGNGPSSNGIAGTSIAFPQDTTAAADNPAGMAFVGSRLDVFGLLVVGAGDVTSGSTANHLYSRIIKPAPGLGANWDISPQWTAGVAVYGAGIGTYYGGPIAPVPGASKASSSLLVVNTAPTVTYKPLPNLAIGASAIFGLQQFRVNGLVGTGPTGAVGVPSHGTAYATGVGAGIGVLWKPLPWLDIGASYYTKTWFTPLSGYRDDVLANSTGRLNMPSRYGVGIALHPINRVTLALDYLKIKWSSADGYNDATSFGWHDQNVLRFGVAYDVSDKLTVRAGFFTSSSFLDSDHTNANLFANGICDKGVTIGATYNLDKKNALTASLEYDIPRTVVGTGPSTGTNITARFQVYSVGYTHKF